MLLFQKSEAGEVGALLLMMPFNCSFRNENEKLAQVMQRSVSELGLAQCEDSFPTTKPKRTVTPVSIVYWKQGVSIIRRKVLEGEKRWLSATRDFGTLY